MYIIIFRLSIFLIKFFESLRLRTRIYETAINKDPTILKDKTSIPKQKGRRKSSIVNTSLVDDFPENDLFVTMFMIPFIFRRSSLVDFLRDEIKIENKVTK